MTEDLKAIEALSDQWIRDVCNSPKYSSENAIVLIDSIVERGQKILRMYEGETAKAPNDADVKVSMAQHQFRMGLHNQLALIPMMIDVQPHIPQGVCRYMHASFETVPSAKAAHTLAEMFRMVKFNSTALYWYMQAENSFAPFDDDEAVIEAKSRRLDLQAEGELSDPRLSPNFPFPTRETVGLILSNQPVQSEDADSNKATEQISTPVPIHELPGKTPPDAPKQPESIRGALEILEEAILARFKINTDTPQGETESTTRTGWRAFLFGREPWK